MYIHKISLAVVTILLTSCGSKDWRLGGDPYNIKTINKRDKERDRHLDHRIDERWDTTKHYVKEHKKKDGKFNLFKRDGFDVGF